MLRAPGVNKKPKATRSGGFHVKTGSEIQVVLAKPKQIRSRIRHVKCDEAKPSCLQCSKTGRTCDGYEDKPPIIFKPQSRARWNTTPDKPLPSIFALAPRFSSDESEIRSFDFFRSGIGPVMFQAFNLSVMDRVIMQLAHSDDTVKHAVVALGSLGEQLSKYKSHSPLALERDSHLRFARVQNAKAICQLRRQLSNGQQQSIELALIACFLFVIFDFLLGDDQSSYAHLKAGLKILRRCYAIQEGVTISNDRALFVAQSPLVIDFARIFTEMDLHAAIWLGLTSCQSPPFIGILNVKTAEAPAKVFLTLEDAADSLHSKSMKIHMLRHSLAEYDSSTSHMAVIPMHMQSERQERLSDLLTWPPALDKLLEQIPYTAESARRLTLMKMNYVSTFINISTVLQPRLADKYLELTPFFRQILGFARMLLRPATMENRVNLLRAIAFNEVEKGSDDIPMFAFVAGVIQPLHLVAEKCVDSSLCREAIALLEETPWREGAWDSLTMATIARRKLETRTSDAS
ncbi:MAG: hypothetical protein Q9195_009326 [Heterodermia aff. obscurata]